MSIDQNHIESPLNERAGQYDWRACGITLPTMECLDNQKHTGAYRNITINSNQNMI